MNINNKKLFLISLICIIVSLTTIYASAHSGETVDADIEVKASGGMFRVPINVDGTTTKILTSSVTVDELLRKAGIELSKNDEVSKSLDEKVKSGDTVTVTRHEYKTETKTEKVPAKTIYTLSPELNANAEKVIKEGHDGKRTVVKKLHFIDGELEGETILKEEVITEVVHKEVLQGFPVKPVSPFDFECSFDENGDPVEYESVLESVKSAGYTARAGALTASGRKAIPGHVAVDPNTIPYGSKLYIKSTDGKHIYGYAVAADTGLALKQGLIAVDLFYASYDEAAANGIREVDIFILKEDE